MHDLLVHTSSKVTRNTPINLIDADRELFEDAIRYETNDVYLKSFGSTWVSSNSVVYKNGVLIEETLATIDQQSYYRFRHLAKKIVTAKSVRLNSSKKYLLATDAWSTGHFHWFTETLPRLWIIRDRAAEFVLLLPDTPYIRKTGLESIETLKLMFDDVVFMSEGEFYKVKDLSFVSRIADAGQMNDELMKELNQAFVGKQSGGERKIYFSRANARFRKVLNETEFTTELRNQGFEIIYGESNSLQEQISVFSQCSTLVGIHGAGLANSIFMKPGGTVVELRKREKNYGYWHLADSLGHKYIYYDGIPDSANTLIGHGCNLTISVADFEQAVILRYLNGYTT